MMRLFERRLFECNVDSLKDDDKFNLGLLLLDRKTLKATYNDIIVFDSEDIKDRIGGLERQIEKLERHNEKLEKKIEDALNRIKDLERQMEDPETNIKNRLNNLETHVKNRIVDLGTHFKYRVNDLEAYVEELVKKIQDIKLIDIKVDDELLCCMKNKIKFGFVMKLVEASGGGSFRTSDDVKYVQNQINAWLHDPNYFNNMKSITIVRL